MLFDCDHVMHTVVYNNASIIILHRAVVVSSTGISKARMLYYTCSAINLLCVYRRCSFVFVESNIM